MSAIRSSPRNTVSIVIAPSRTGDVRQWDIPEWKWRLGLWGGVALGALAFGGAVALLQAGWDERRASALEAENETLRSQFHRVDELERQLQELSRQNAQMRLLAGLGTGGTGTDAPGQPRATHADTMTTFGRQLEWRTPWTGPITRRFHPGPGAATHPGIDVSGGVGSLILAAGDGQVETAGFDSVYGLHAIVAHPDGYQTLYGHADSMLVAAGDRVSAGEPLATLGSTGRSSGPHLHFEVRRDGAPLDPGEVIPGYRVPAR